jgi:hypothetical protein
VTLRCRSCGARFSLSEFRESLDDNLEELLADTRCDRL